MRKEIFYTPQVRKFIETLPKEAEAKLFRAILTLSHDGMLHAPVAEKVEGQKGLYEIRVRDVCGQYRVLYAYEDEASHIWLLSGLQKKTQKTPIAEIKRALRIKREIGL